jgi:hypothetical protein
MRWNPSREEIQDWLYTKEHEFTRRDTKGLITNNECLEERYIYTDFHELFFTEFPCSLYEWMKRKTTINTSLRSL